MKLLIPTLIFLLAGCSAETSESDTFDLPFLEIEHVIEISESEDLLLSSITNLLVDSEGDLILVDGSQRLVYAVNSNGKFIQQIGRHGSGPGEYQFPGIVALSNDNQLHIFDFSSQSVINYTKENGEWNFDSDFGVNFSEYGFFSTFFPAGNQEFYVVTNPMIASDDESESVVRKINNQGKVVQDSIYSYPQNERFTVIGENGPSMAMTIPNMHRQGRFNVDFEGNQYFGWTDSLTILRKSPEKSSFVPVVHIDANNLPFTDATRDSILSRYSVILENNNQARRDLISSFPDTKPVYSDFKIDDEGRIWVQMFNEEEDTEWVLFSDEGEPLYRVSLPDRNNLRTIRHGNIYSVENTEEGLPVINIYSIIS
ncbi:6-bladed beta-propeller [Rhodohalobacter halophilus]|uniref:6-bladed beta-propeller n=1 Tax=Rhodohalobacter halophilus TaxID=1812810 RepID=UPI00083F6E66|nr:6-bladed beta-propeller [Rhodohalobacter halophilus]